MIQVVLERKVKEINQNAAEQEVIMHPFKSMLEHREELSEQIERLEVEVGNEQNDQN